MTNCDREPIHQPGAIQPHGILFVCDASDLIITHASENVFATCGLAIEQVIGKHLTEILPSQRRDDFMELLSKDRVGSRPNYIFTLPLVGTSSMFDAIAHQAGSHLFVEFEPHEANRDHSAPELYGLVQNAITRMQEAVSVEELCGFCADQVSLINGFDRVMVYRFDNQWNGEVVAESKRDDLESFLGLHYPASDIPQQARQLYTRNWLRFIADRDYKAVRISPAVSAESDQPLDMSFSVLRSVSPIHIEYLRNMGVSATMSVSLVREGRLWGLIACHHYSPRYVPYDIRTACEMLGQFMSLSLAAAEDREKKDYRATIESIIEEMMGNVEKTEDIASALVDRQPDLLALIPCDGTALILGDRIVRLGQTPNEEVIRELATWVVPRMDNNVYSTENLESVFGTALLGGVASGILALSLSRSRAHLVFWFRAEQVRNVDWAGDPKKTIAKGGGDDVRLSPRGSFSLWKETVRGHSAPWTDDEMEAVFRLREELVTELIRRTEIIAASNNDLRLASEEREKALASERSARVESERVSRMKDDFVATLSHELRTPLNAILGWAQLLTRFSDVSGEVHDGLEVIERNARAQAQMIEDLLDMSRVISGKLRLDVQDTHLPSIVASAVETVKVTADAKGVRIESMIDPLLSVQTTGDPNRLQQVVWNLLSNAVKFTPKGGKVQVFLERVNSHVELSISDTGKGIDAEFLPYVFDRFRQAESSSSRNYGGLGLGLSIVRSLVELHGGTVGVFSRGDNMGSLFTVSLPIRVVHTTTAPPSTDRPGQESTQDTDGLNLAGLRVLELDDESDARELMLHILKASKCVVATCECADDALQLLERETFDVIISDIGMPNKDGYEFMRQWRAKEGLLHRDKTPAVALTAYARGEDRRRALMAGFQAHVAKPVDRDELLAIIASLANRV